MSLLHEEASPKLLRLVTSGVFGFWLLQLVFSPVDSLAALPMSLYEPVGFLRGVPDSVVAWLLSVPVIFTIYPRVFSMLACAGFPVVTLFEMFAPLCFISSRFRWMFLIVMLPFHLLAWIVMEIFFGSTCSLHLIL